MSRLSELHEAVKDHPYRVSMSDRYLKSYQGLLYDLSHAFYEAIIETEYKPAYNMTHDFNHCISVLDWERVEEEYKNNAIAHVERCIGTIHEFIETGKVLSYWTYYTGVNKLENSPRVKKVVYKDGEYLLSLPKKVKNACLDEIRKHNRTGTWPEWGIYGKDYYSWIEKAVEEDE